MCVGWGWGGGIVLCESPVRGKNVGVGVAYIPKEGTFCDHGHPLTHNFLSNQLIKFCSP